MRFLPLALAASAAAWSIPKPLCMLALDLLAFADPSEIPQAKTFCSSYIRPTVKAVSTTVLTHSNPGPTTTVGTITETSVITSTSTATASITTTYSTNTIVLPTTVDGGITSTTTTSVQTPSTTSTYTETINGGTSTSTVYAESTYFATFVEEIDQTSTQVATTSAGVYVTIVTGSTTVRPVVTSTQTSTSTSYVPVGAPAQKRSNRGGPPPCWSNFVPQEESAACTCLLSGSLPAPTTVYTSIKTQTVQSTGSPTPITATASTTSISVAYVTVTSVASEVASTTSYQSFTTYDGTATSVAPSTASEVVIPATQTTTSYAATQTVTSYYITLTDEQEGYTTEVVTQTETRTVPALTITNTASVITYTQGSTSTSVVSKTVIQTQTCTTGQAWPTQNFNSPQWTQENSPSGEYTINSAESLTLQAYSTTPNEWSADIENVCPFTISIQVTFSCTTSAQTTTRLAAPYLEFFVLATTENPYSQRVVAGTSNSDSGSDPSDFICYENTGSTTASYTATVTTFSQYLDLSFQAFAGQGPSGPVTGTFTISDITVSMQYHV